MHEEERAALEEIERLARLDAIRLQRDANLSKLGQQQALAGHPSVSAETQARLETAEADADAERLALVHGEAAAAFHLAERAEREAKRALDQALQDQGHALNAVLQELQRLAVRLEPELDSLLAYLRGSESARWAGLAKVIDPALLGRQDLRPETSGEMEAGGDIVVVGAVALNLRNVAQPDWVDTRGACRAKASRNQSPGATGRH